MTCKRGNSGILLHFFFEHCGWGEEDLSSRQRYFSLLPWIPSQWSAIGRNPPSIILTLTHTYTYIPWKRPAAVRRFTRESAYIRLWKINVRSFASCTYRTTIAGLVRRRSWQQTHKTLLHRIYIPNVQCIQFFFLCSVKNWSVLLIYFWSDQRGRRHLGTMWNFLQINRVAFVLSLCITLFSVSLFFLLALQSCAHATVSLRLHEVHHCWSVDLLSLSSVWHFMKWNSTHSTVKLLQSKEWFSHTKPFSSNVIFVESDNAEWSVPLGSSTSSEWCGRHTHHRPISF